MIVAEAPDEQRQAGRPWVKAILVLICVGILVMWVYAFVFASKKGVYRVDDANWRAKAEQTCSAAQTERLRLVDVSGGYIANPTHEQMIQRADVVDKATDILDKMVTDMVAVPVATGRDRELIAAFESYYRTLLADRRAYTKRLRAFDLAPYRETLIGQGPVTNVVTDFTSGNGILSCTPPGELGGDL